MTVGSCRTMFIVKLLSIIVCGAQGSVTNLEDFDTRDYVDTRNNGNSYYARHLRKLAGNLNQISLTKAPTTSPTASPTASPTSSPSANTSNTCAGVAPYTNFSDQRSDPKHGNACFKPGGPGKGGGDWQCPVGCKKVSSAPWCVEAKNNTAICRVAEKVAGDLPAS